MPARSRRAPAPPAPHKVRVSGAGPGGPGARRGPPSAESRPRGTLGKLGRDPKSPLWPGPAHLRSGVPPVCAARAGVWSRPLDPGRLPSGRWGARPPPLSGARRRWASRTRRGGVPACPSSPVFPTCLPLPPGDPLQGGKARAKIKATCRARVGAQGRSASGTRAPPWLRCAVRPALRPLRTVPAARPTPIRGRGTRRPRSHSERVTCQGFPKGGLDGEALVGDGDGAPVSLPPNPAARSSYFSRLWMGFFLTAEFRTQVMCPSVGFHADSRASEGRGRETLDVLSLVGLPLSAVVESSRRHLPASRAAVR